MRVFKVLSEDIIANNKSAARTRYSAALEQTIDFGTRHANGSSELHVSDFPTRNPGTNGMNRHIEILRCLPHRAWC
jgi:hypothetical protein